MAKRNRRLKAEMNIVPYVDVMFVLLTIFMVTASVISVGIEVDLPETSSVMTEEDPQEQEMLIVSVNQHGQLFLNLAMDPEQPQNEDELFLQARSVLDRTPQIQVLVRADKSVAYGEVVRAMAVLQRAGASKVGLPVYLTE